MPTPTATQVALLRCPQPLLRPGLREACSSSESSCSMGIVVGFSPRLDLGLSRVCQPGKRKRKAFWEARFAVAVANCNGSMISRP